MSKPRTCYKVDDFRKVLYTYCSPPDHLTHIDVIAIDIERDQHLPPGEQSNQVSASAMLTSMHRQE